LVALSPSEELRRISAVGVPIAIFVVCLLVGVFASSQWLPELRRGRVGGLALFVVCGLIGASLAVAGLRIYSIVKDVKASSGFGHDFRAEAVASGLATMLWEAGSLVALAMVVYLLAPDSEPLAGSESD
jgi:hypothetical protein